MSRRKNVLPYDSNSNRDVIGSRPKPDFGPLFETAAEVVPVWDKKIQTAALAVYAKLDSVPWPSPAIFASHSAGTDDAEKFLLLAERIAKCLLDATGTMAVWQVRVQLKRLELIDGKEKLDCLGSLGTRMGLVAIGNERAPVLKEIEESHGNRNTIWARAEDARRIA